MTGKVVTYISGERAGEKEDTGEDLVKDINVFARYQTNDGTWSPVFKTTTTEDTYKSKTGRTSNYAIKMLDFVGYDGYVEHFRPGEGKAQRLQVWLDPYQVKDYRLTFSERTGGVIQGYSSGRDWNYASNNQVMQWGFLPAGKSRQVSQVNIGLIKVANTVEDLLGTGVAIQPSLPTPSTARNSTLKGYVRWENQTPNRGGPAENVGRPNVKDFAVNTTAGGYVVVAAMRDGKGNVEARCTTTTQLSPDADRKASNWQINFEKSINVKQMKFQVFTGTCDNPKPLPNNIAYWSPFPKTVDDWGTNLGGGYTSEVRGWYGLNENEWAKDVRVLLRPLNMHLLPHGNNEADTLGTQVFFGDKVEVKYKNLPRNTPLVAHLYSGKINDTGPEGEQQTLSFTAGPDGNGSFEFPTALEGNKIQEYWVDVVPEKITENPQWQVLASQSFLYKPILLQIDSGVVNQNGEFQITQIVPNPDATGIKLKSCEVVSDTIIDSTATRDSLPAGLTRKEDACTLEGTPEKSGVHPLWVKFWFADKDNNEHLAVQYVPWNVAPRIKPQIELDTPDADKAKFSDVEKFPTAGVPYHGLVTPFADREGRAFSYQIFTSDPSQGNPSAEVPGQDGLVTLGDSGLKINPTTGQITGNPKDGKSAIFWAKATDEDGQITPAEKFEIYPGTPMLLQRAQLPTGSSGSAYQNGDGTPIVIWVSGGELTAPTLTAEGKTLSRNTYTKAEILSVKDGEGAEVNADNIGGVKCETKTSTGSEGGQFILCSGTPDVTAATTYYLQVKYTDKFGRVLDGSKYTLPRIKALSSLSGTEGWLKMTLLPQVKADPTKGDTLPAGTKGKDYGTVDVKTYLTGGTGDFGDYTFSAAGLLAGLRMDANGVITGKPLDVTASAGAQVTVYLRGKDGTPAERSNTTVTFKLPVKTDLNSQKDSLSATAKGGTTYTDATPLLDVNTADITGGVKPYSYKLQYLVGTTWEEAIASGGGYQVPNADTDHKASGLLLNANGKIVGSTSGKAVFPQLRVVVTDSDNVSCQGGCSVTVELNLSRTDDRYPNVASDAAITARVGETVKGTLPINDPSGKPIKYEVKSKTLLDGVTLEVDADNGQYTLKASNSAVAGNGGSVSLTVTGANGNTAEEVTLRINVVDERVPNVSNLVEISLEQGIPVEKTSGTTDVKGAVKVDESPKIECFVPAADKLCPEGESALSGLTGIKLNPDGTLTGTPVLGDVGDHAVQLKALGVNGVWSQAFTAQIIVKPSTLVFEPGLAPGGTTGQPYEWTFNPATGADGVDKSYQVLDKDRKAVTGCRVNVTDGKPQLRCDADSLHNGETYTLRATAGTGDTAVHIDRVFTPEIYPPLTMNGYALPAAAVKAVYLQNDGNPFRFTAAGGSGNYTFSFKDDSPHTKANAPEPCSGWKLNTAEGEDSGLCLELDGRVTGTPLVAGTVDFSHLQVTDSAQHVAGLPADATKTLKIMPLLEINTDCVKPADNADKYDSYACHGVKKQPVGQSVNQGDSLRIATVSGGATPYKDLRVEGLDAYNAGVADAEKIKADWCPGSDGKSDPSYICLTGTWQKVMAPGSSLNVYVTGDAGRTVTVEAFIPVETDLAFTDQPDDPVKGATLKKTADGNKPGNISGDIWNKVVDKTGIPTIGVKLDEAFVKNQTSLDLPSLVTGGVDPYTYTTEPCESTDSNGNCAIGDTGLYLNKTTGKITGTPKPGTSAAVVVKVTDSDIPPQSKESNLVIEIPDTRKPVVASTTINAEVEKQVSQVIPVSEGSGEYSSVDVSTDKPGWMTVTLRDNVLTVTGTPGAGDVTTNGTFTVTVNDKNGNKSDSATITYIVTDMREPDLSGLSQNGNLTGTEGKEVQGWTDLPVGTTAYGPKIDTWEVSGLPDGVTFDPDTGTLSPNKISSGQSGTFPVTITATAKNGQKTTIVKNLVVIPSDLKVEAQPAGTLTQGGNLNDRTIAKVTGGSAPYTLGSVTGLPQGLNASLDSNGNIVLNGTIPNGAQDTTVTLTVTDNDGVTRTLTRSLTFGVGLSIANTVMPTATVGASETYGPHCLGVSGGTPGYSVTGSPAGLPGGMTLEANNDGSDICLSGTPTSGAGQAATVTFTAQDSASPTPNTKGFSIKIPVNDKFSVTEPGTPGDAFAGSQFNFKPVTGSGDTCYALSSAGECEKAKITYSAVGLPAGLSINPNTGEIAGTPTEPVKNQMITVTVASDAPGNQPISKDFRLTVKSAFENSANGFNIVPNPAVTPELNENGMVKTDGDQNQVLTKPVIKNGNDTVATGKYSIQGATPNTEGNYPLDDTGLALTPDGKLVGTLKPGQPTQPGTNGTFNLGNYPIILQDDKGGEQIGPTTVNLTVQDSREPTITLDKATVEVGKASTIPITVSGGSGKIDETTLSNCNPDSTGLSVDGDKIKVPASAYTQGGTITCKVTVKDHNGKTVSKDITITVNDTRVPMFNVDGKEPYAWQGLDFTQAALGQDPAKKGIPVSQWIVDNATDPTAAPVKEVKISGLPDNFTVNDKNKDTDGSYTCNALNNCTIVGYASKNVEGVKDFTLTVTAATKNGGNDTNLKVSKSIPMHIFASPLQISNITPQGMIRGDGVQYSSTIATVDYLGTLANEVDSLKSESTWAATYALDGNTQYAIGKVTAYKRDGSSADLASGDFTLSAANSTAAALPAPGSDSKKAQNLTLKSMNTSQIPEGTTSLAVVIKVTDGHGVERSTTVTIPVVQKLEWAGPPFKSDDNLVVLSKVGITGEAYPNYYAEAKGGDGSFSTSLAESNKEIKSAIEADAKAGWKNNYSNYDTDGAYKGIKPVYCEAQGSLSRPKCFPIPGLGGTIPGSAYNPDTPLSKDHKGLFMLSNGKLYGSIPDNAAPGPHTAQVLVIDGSGQLIKKTFTIKVEQKLRLNIPNKSLPDGKKGICYGTDDKPGTNGCNSSVEVGQYVGGTSTTASCQLEPPVHGLNVSCDNGMITISGAPNQTYDGDITVKVTLSDGAGQTVEESLPLFIATDMKFVETDNVKVQTDQDNKQTVSVDVTAGGDLPDMKLDIQGGMGDIHYSIENEDGTKVSPVDCPSGVTSSPGSNKSLVCYPIGSTGLILDSEGKVHGTPIPGGSSSGKFVVADSDTSSRPQRAEIKVTIADHRPPAVYDLVINTTVDAAALNGSTQLLKDDPQNPEVSTTNQDTWTQEQQAAAAQKGFHTTMPTGVLGTVPDCPAGVAGKPDWLTVNEDGFIAVANGSKVPVGAPAETQFCVYYVGPNGVIAPKPAVVTVKVTDQRRPSGVTGNGQTTNAVIGKPLTDPNDSTKPDTLIDLKIPSDMFNYGANQGTVSVSKLNPDGSECTGTDCKFTVEGNGNFTDKTIDGLTVSGLNCVDGANTGDPKNCSIKVTGTPTPKAAGDHQLTYKVTLPNGQTQIISHTIHVPPYSLDLSVTDMNPAVVGIQYLPFSKPILATGGSDSSNPANYLFKLWSHDSKPAKVGDMQISLERGPSVKLDWTPKKSDLDKANAGVVTAIVTVWDKQACNFRPYPSEDDLKSCDYRVTKPVKIRLYDAPDTTEIKVPAVTEGKGAISAPVYKKPSQAAISATIPSGNEDYFTFNPDTGQVTMKKNAPVDTYTVVIEITLPGVTTPFTRNVVFTVKEAPVQDQNPTPNPEPGYDPGDRTDTQVPVPPADEDPLVVRHGGEDRIGTALAVLDFFIKDGAAGRADNLVVAYSEYGDKVGAPWSNTAVLVRDDDYPDALVAGPLAAHYNSPILMTPTDKAPKRLLDSLRGHGFTKVILVGNQGAISDQAAAQFRNAGFQVDRLGGQDRYQTAGAVADHLLAARGQQKSDVYLATGRDFPDALTASSAAIKNTGVVLLTPKGELENTGKSWMDSPKAAKLIGVGGPAAQAAKGSVHLDEAQVGADRYETAQKVASTYFPPSPGRVAVATGTDFPDATLAASVTARTGAPLVLSRPETLTKPTAKFLGVNKASVQKVDIVGGTGAVGEAVRYEIHQALGR